MKTVHAVFENGVFRPRDPVNLPEHAEVEFEPRPALSQTLVRPSEAELDTIYEVLSHRHHSGDAHGAARHDEHQP